MSANICAPLQALTAFELSVVQAINKKFAALQRLAQLLEQLGDISAFLPNIGQLLPVASLDLSAYQALQLGCPFLNLPPATTASIAALQGKLQAAYAALLAQLRNHPWSRLNSVQAMLNEFQSKLNFPFGDDYLRCLNNVCNAIGTAGSLLSGASSFSISNDLKAFATGFVANGGQVLSAVQQTKRDQALTTYNQVLALQDPAVVTFQAPGTQPQPPAVALSATTPAFTASLTSGFPTTFPSQ